MLPIAEFKYFIEKHQLFKPDERILLAVSGGRDSVVMLHLFRSVGIHIGIAHCNFQLRADEAQRDENFVKMLAHSFDLPFYVTHFDTKKYAFENKISTQMAARELRYAWFEEIRSQHQYHYIALAQHQNDAVETVLINLTRGTGISGLHGILPKRDRLIRPLLFLNRHQIDELVMENNLVYVEDSSNLSTAYTRNKLRRQVIPHLQEINPALEQTFMENISRFREIEEFLHTQVQELARKMLVKKNDGLYMAIEEISRLHPKKLLLFELLKPFHFTQQQVDDLLESLTGMSGKTFNSISHQAIVNRSELIIVETNPAFVSNQMIHPGTAAVQFAHQEIKMNVCDEVIFEPHVLKAFVDAEKLIFPLVVRTWQQGDRFIPLGMKQFKKLSDYFIDEKVPLHLKTRIPLLINGNGDIIWIAGMRQDNRYKLMPATKKVAIFELKNI